VEEDPSEDGLFSLLCLLLAKLSPDWLVLLLFELDWLWSTF
jgi:hypothetical protein